MNTTLVSQPAGTLPKPSLTAPLKLSNEDISAVQTTGVGVLWD